MVLFNCVVNIDISILKCKKLLELVNLLAIKLRQSYLEDSAKTKPKEKLACLPNNPTDEM